MKTKIDLKNRLSELNLSAEMLAQHCNVRPGSIKNILNGNNLPSRELAFKIAQILGVSLKDIPHSNKRKRQSRFIGSRKVRGGVAPVPNPAPIIIAPKPIKKGLLKWLINLIFKVF